MIGILLVDHHTASRESFASVLGREPDLAVAAEAGSVAEVRAAIPAADVAVVADALPDGDPLELLGELRAASPRVRMLVLCADDDRRRTARALRMSAAGVLPRTACLASVLGAIRRLAAGEALHPPSEVAELLQLYAW